MSKTQVDFHGQHNGHTWLIYSVPASVICVAEKPWGSNKNVELKWM